MLCHLRRFAIFSMEKVLRSTLKDGKFQFLSPRRSHVMRSVKPTGNKSTELRLRGALI
ncbi:hypothetical protein BH18ACI4_BH18ACI4_00810 [soil metagenome]